jgi:hypothetical protein
MVLSKKERTVSAFQRDALLASATACPRSEVFAVLLSWGYGPGVSTRRTKRLFGKVRLPIPAQNPHRATAGRSQI